MNLNTGIDLFKQTRMGNRIGLCVRKSSGFGPSARSSGMSRRRTRYCAWRDGCRARRETSRYSWTISVKEERLKVSQQ